MGKSIDRVEKVCPWCNKTFYVLPSAAKRHTFCSEECKAASRASKKKTCICEVCGKSFVVAKTRKNARFCSVECKSIGMSEKETRICRYCGKKFSVNKSSDMLCCSDECQRLWRQSHDKVHGKCDYCGKDILISQWKLKHAKAHYCSQECSQKGSKTGSWDKCSNCGKPVWRMKSKTSEHVFCDQTCADEYRERQKVYNTCKQCGKKYFIKAGLADKSRFCSTTCMSKWQSIHWVGMDNPHFNSRLSRCPYCGKEIYIKPNEENSRMRKFCSRKCATAFYLMPENRTEKQKASDYKLATEAINYIKPTLTGPHIKVNAMLDELRIKYENEHIVHYYSLDIYLPDNKLSIEINGTYWHADPRRFSIIKYVQQKASIARDKSKDTYIKNKYGYNILYLWERDVEDAPEVCKALIMTYVENNGALSNYHSFNYHMENDTLKLNDTLITPYSEMDVKDLPIGDNLKHKEETQLAS